jgi:hypothetical protein
MPSSFYKQSEGANAMAAAAATDLYVALTGSDTEGDGSFTKPFATLFGAQSEIRKTAVASRGPITVNVRAGTYYLTRTLEFTPEDSGAAAGANGGIVWKPYQNESVTLSGGMKLELDWQPCVQYACRFRFRLENRLAGFAVFRLDATDFRSVHTATGKLSLPNHICSLCIHFGFGVAFRHRLSIRAGAIQKNQAMWCVLVAHALHKPSITNQVCREPNHVGISLCGQAPGGCSDQLYQLVCG